MSESDRIDNALCELNRELLDIKHSKEYQRGLKVSKFLYSVKHLDISALFIAMTHKRVSKILKKNHRKNEMFLTYNDSITTTKRIAVYTCITGNYDVILEPVYVPNNVDFYIVTDMEVNKSSSWKKIDINQFDEIKKLDNTRKARYVKTHPDLFFGDYEFSIWIDSNFKVIGDLSKYIKCIGEKVPFASNWHPTRNSIYTEKEACILKKKDEKLLLEKQVEYYRQKGMPEDFGLIETNMIVRKHNDERCKALMEAWWNEIATWSKRDQISLPYAIWRQGYTMQDLGFICTEIRNNPSVQVQLHTSKYRCPT